MTKKELRIAIAKDVIKSLRRLTPAKGIYIGVRLGKDTAAERVLSKEKDSKKVADKIKGYCEVCALGACFLSAVTVDNKWDFSRWNDLDYGDEQLSKRLSQIFSPGQMGLIEAAFECGDSGMFVNTADKSFDKSVEFGKRFRTERSRLKGIMENIIENDGIFKP